MKETLTLKNCLLLLFLISIKPKLYQSIKIKPLLSPFLSNSFYRGTPGTIAPSPSLFLQSPPVVVGGAGVIILCFAVRFNSEPHTGAERVLPPLKPRGTTAGRGSSKGTPPAAFKRECSCFYVPASAASLPQTTPQLSFYFRCVIGR